MYENPILPEIIHSQWFSSIREDGIEFSAAFNPIPNALIALVFMAVCLSSACPFVSGIDNLDRSSLR